MVRPGVAGNGAKGKTLIRLMALPCARVGGDGMPDGGTGDG
jgi:hypothetical protein